MITAAEGEVLIRLARDSINSGFTGKPAASLKAKNLMEKRGVFVTLNKSGQLRGCIGFTEPIYALQEGVSIAAKAAAFDDPRFPPLKQQELRDIQVEISVLTLPEPIEVKNPIEYLKRIRIGRDGLIRRSGRAEGLLLPQVATEYGWSPDEFLTHLCRKAGLAPGAWKDLSNRIYAFQAQVFHEANGK